ncbi:MAG: hypothetical protein HIU86_01165 [Acidobacteria bacterium]|nr:hypothetical protein [Acidobacteriota bacterium]
MTPVVISTANTIASATRHRARAAMAWCTTTRTSRAMDAGPTVAPTAVAATIARPGRSR